MACGGESSAEGACDLVGLGEAPELLLGEDLTTVGKDLEHTARPSHQLDLEIAELWILLQLVRQTGGSRLVVSRAAIGDSQFHLVPAPLPGGSV